ncbi:cytochrome C assembly family protein [Marinimicrobium alkaliphilum]|uniref:cytochrome C assembly family protein n=1 Tax=Marinimicrobium alkaliphilum TaxID=2202654 RepID=UPI000DBAD492|nr:cytochrome c biogenesis protein CcsA [Marinimicrobium alkaliphilum]
MTLTLIGSLIAILLYASASAYLAVRFYRQHPAQPPLSRVIAALALIVHGASIYGLSVDAEGLRLGFFQSASLIFWVINCVVLLSSLKKPLHNLFIPLFAFSALAVSAALLGRESGRLLPFDLGLYSHILLSITAYSLLTIATLQALMLAWQHYQLKHKHATGKVRLLPPLQTMEALLFELLWAGQILLTLSILSGFWFLDNLFGQHLAHKSVFSIAAWTIYAVLLWGRHRLGWRGYTAIRWTLVGFSLLMLAYFGSKLVLELILERA